MKKTILLLLTLTVSLSLQAQIRGNEIHVTVTPDHKDWNYHVGEKASFVVNVLRSGTLIDNAQVDFEAGPEMYPDVKKENVVLKDGTMKWQGTLKKPGFYRLKVTAHVNGKDYRGLCTAAFNPEELKPFTQNPDDFDTFWTQILEEARHTSLEPTMTLLPDRCTNEVNVYEVSFQNIRWGSRTFGILCVPTKPGKYPALLRVPGAGVRPYTGDVWFASQGAIVLEIGIHGVSVTQPQSFYDHLSGGALNGYWEFNTADRNLNYYKRVIVGAIRAIDYIEEYTPWDGKNLGVTGSSQGGFLSLACAGLDKRVSCFGAVHAAMCDYEAALKGVACGWPHYYYQKKTPDMKQVEATRYYDGVNFARRITAPGWFSFGYNDEVVPPTTAFATFNTVTAPKTLRPFQLTGHYWFQEQWDEWVDWLLKELHVK